MDILRAYVFIKRRIQLAFKILGFKFKQDNQLHKSHFQKETDQVFRSISWPTQERRHILGKSYYCNLS